MIAKAVIILFILIILFCLGSGLYYLMHDRVDSTRMLKALTWRIGLSVLLFLLLMAGFATGMLKPNHVELFEPVTVATK